jgi:hypothetical protein
MRGADAITSRVRGAGGIEKSLRAEQPLLAPRGESLAPGPQGERLLEVGGALLEFGDDADELVPGLLEGQIGDVGGRVAGHGVHSRPADVFCERALRAER